MTSENALLEISKGNMIYLATSVWMSAWLGVSQEAGEDPEILEAK